MVTDRTEMHSLYKCVVVPAVLFIVVVCWHYHRQSYGRHCRGRLHQRKSSCLALREVNKTRESQSRAHTATIGWPEPHDTTPGQRAQNTIGNWCAY